MSNLDMSTLAYQLSVMQTECAAIQAWGAPLGLMYGEVSEIPIQQELLPFCEFFTPSHDPVTTTPFVDPDRN